MLERNIEIPENEKLLAGQKNVLVSDNWMALVLALLSTLCCDIFKTLKLLLFYKHNSDINFLRGVRASNCKLSEIQACVLLATKTRGRKTSKI